jgi:hypothetical protein
VFAQLAERGMDRSPARLSHTCFEVGDKLEVIDVWESVEDFQAFGQTLVPILTSLGVTMPPPAISPVVHTVIAGEHAWA